MERKIIRYLKILTLMFVCVLVIQVTLCYNKDVSAANKYKVYQFMASGASSVYSKRCNLYVKATYYDYIKTNAKLTLRDDVGNTTYAHTKTFKYKMTKNVKWIHSTVSDGESNKIYSEKNAHKYSLKKLQKELKSYKKLMKEGTDEDSWDYAIIVILKNNKVIKVVEGVC